MKSQTGSKWLIVQLGFIHFVFFIYFFFNCLYFTFPDEPGYDPARAAWSGICSKIVGVLGFPVLNISMMFHPVSPIFEGVLGWVWFFLNSCIWGWMYYFLRTRLCRKEQT